MPVELLAQALLDLRTARGNPEATRQAVIRYFKAGIAAGFQVGPLLQWPFFWPREGESVFGQAGFTIKQSIAFIDILKKMHAQEIGIDVTKENTEMLED